MGHRRPAQAAAVALMIVTACAPLPPQGPAPVAPTAATTQPASPAPARAPETPLPDVASESPSPAATAGSFEPVSAGDLEWLRNTGLLMPVKGAARAKLEDSFDAPRDGGRRHDAVDILAPRGTPIVSATDGTIARIGQNTLGGNTVWVIDADQRFTYYYAHLDRYARIKQGERVTRGTVLGYVGTTGNAPPDVPHLHFQVMRITDPKRWWDGTPVNPFPYLLEPGAIALLSALRAP